MKQGDTSQRTGGSDSSSNTRKPRQNSPKILRLEDNPCATNPTNIKQDPSFKIIRIALEELRDRYNLSFDDIRALIEGKNEGLTLPISIFHNQKLSALEIICKYLKEETSLSFSQIGSLLNRNPRTVWTTYSNAVRKQKCVLNIEESLIRIPVHIFCERKFSILEILVSHLKDHHSLSFAQISSFLQKDPRNIWTVYSRFRKKIK